MATVDERAKRALRRIRFFSVMVGAHQAAPGPLDPPTAHLRGLKTTVASGGKVTWIEAGRP